MFIITENNINTILRDYHIYAECSSFTELQRYNYEEDDPKSREVRLIVKPEKVSDSDTCTVGRGMCAEQGAEGDGA